MIIELVLEKAPDLEMKLDRAAIPSTVQRIVDRAMDREAVLKTPPVVPRLNMWFLDSKVSLSHGQAVVSAVSGRNA